MSDLTYMHTERVRKALLLRDGKVDYGEFVDEWLNVGRDVHNLPTLRGGWKFWYEGSTLCVESKDGKTVKKQTLDGKVTTEKIRE